MLEYYIDLCFVFQKTLFSSGWIVDTSSLSNSGPIAISVRFPSGESLPIQPVFVESPDIERIYGKIGRQARFEFTLALPGEYHRRISVEELNGSILIFQSRHERREVSIAEAKHQRDQSDSYYNTSGIFLEYVNKASSGKLLELGSRARMGISRRDFFPEHIAYTGFDIKAGENVDVVGDAHKLSAYFSPNTFDFIFSVAVFEHLLMPWRVALEMNKVMKTGAIAEIVTHQTWPLHEEPWDYFRFSAHAWYSIFNKYTGFEILKAVMGDHAFITAFFPRDHIPVTGVGYLGSRCICRKIGEPTVRWEADPEEIIHTEYPY